MVMQEPLDVPTNDVAEGRDNSKSTTLTHDNPIVPPPVLPTDLLVNKMSYGKLFMMQRKKRIKKQ